MSKLVDYVSSRSWVVPLVPAAERTVLVNSNRKLPPIASQGLIDEWVAMDCDERVNGQLC